MWALDYQFDVTATGRIIKILHVVDEFTRESLTDLVDQLIDADATVTALDKITAQRRRHPSFVRCDNGPELTANALRDWCRFTGTGTSYIEPGSPWENPWVESYGSRMRDELLAIEQFASLLEAQVLVGDWRTEYNTYRPHSALDGLTPADYAEQWRQTNQSGSAAISSAPVGRQRDGKLLPRPDRQELRVGRLIINNAITVNGAFEAPAPEPDGWLVLDPDSLQASLEMWQAADAMVLGRKTYEGLAAVWPQMTDLPGLEAYAEQMNSMPKYVASRTLSGPLEWNATLLEGNLADSVSSLKDEHHGNLVVSGAGELARDLMTHGLVDEVWFTVSPYLWATGPRIFDDVGAVRLELVATTTFPSGVVLLCYRPAPADTPSTG